MDKLIKRVVLVNAMAWCRAIINNRFGKKWKSISFALICSATFHTAHSQPNYDSTFVRLKLSDNVLVPSKDKSQFTDDINFNNLLGSLGAVYYDYGYPSASNPELKKYIELRVIPCDIVNVINNLNASDFHVHMEYIEPVETIPDHKLDEGYPIEDGQWFNTHSNGVPWLWHLKQIEADKAWNITLGDPNIRIAVLDLNFESTHPDFTNQLVQETDPYDGQTWLGCHSWGHGTRVAGMASAETTETGNTPAGEYASVGFNTKLLLYHHGGTRMEFLQRALHAVNVMGARVLVTAAGAGIPCGNSLSDCPEETLAIIEEIFDKGAVIVMPAGNGYDGFHCGSHSNYSSHGCFNPEFDDRIIVVTSSSVDDTHYYSEGGIERTHSHFSEVDFCAPGYNVMTMGAMCNEWPYYGASRGTSFSSPLTAGTAALVLSIDPCLEAADVEYILKSTTDPILDADDFPGMVGTGRLNAYQACLLAQTYGQISLEGSGYTLLDNDHYSSTDILIPSGHTLEITGNLRMSANKGIFVSQGAHLIVNGGRITNSKGCGDRWRGIEVWGNAFEHQYSYSGGQYHQGRATFRNGAVIENAWQGVMNWNPSDWDSRGVSSKPVTPAL